MLFAGWSSSDYLLSQIPVAANLSAGANPPYAASDFLTDFSQFETAYGSTLPQTLVQKFIDMANGSLAYGKYAEVWSYCMGLYVAHFCTLYLSASQNSSDASGLVSSAEPLLLKTAESVGDVSVSYDVNSIADDLKNFGSFKATAYGQQLATFAKMAGVGGMTI
jgi:hypothetical protein